MFTPVPWRLITDTALLSENWPGVPRPLRGEVSARYTNCSVCPAGCAVRARCVGGQPVSLAGVEGHPLSRGGLCAFGVAAHQLPYCAGRLTAGPGGSGGGSHRQSGGQLQPGRRGDARARSATPAESIAVLDLRPGRTASWTYRRAMGAVRNGLYLTAAGPFSGAAVDLSKARTVLSLGAPVLDGWGTPGNVLAARANFRLIQAEAIESRTASLADLWLRIRPGSASALAMGIAAALKKGSVADGAAATGLDRAADYGPGRRVDPHGPALVLPGYDCPGSLGAQPTDGRMGRNRGGAPGGPRAGAVEELRAGHQS